MRISGILVFTLICFLSLSSCRKKNKTYLISGRMMIDCNTPAANTKYSLVQRRGFLNGGVVKEFTTDENGFFFANYKVENRQKLEIDNIMEDIPVMKNISIGNVYISPRANIIMNLNVLNPYTSADTLYYVQYNYPNPGYTTLKIPGPFVSGTLDTLFNVMAARPEKYEGLFTVDCSLKLNSTFLPSQTKKVKPCDNTYPNFYFTIQ